MCVSFSQTFCKGLVTQITMPLNPNNDAKLDHSSGTRWLIWNKFAPLDSTAIYPKLGHKLLYTPMTGEMKCTIGYTFPLHILFHLLHCWCNTCTNQITNDMIHFISSRDLVGSSILILLAFHRCLCPSVSSLAQASPPRSPLLQSVQLALHVCNRSIKSSLVLIFSTLVTWLHVMSHMQWAPSSHVWAL
jgi:hypothetical protein